MAVNLSPIWGAGAQLLDNSGNVLSGGKIYTYAAGTTTQVATYTSNTGVTANSNPIVLNSAGRVPYEIWLTDGQNYKFVLKDSNDVLIGTWDNLSGINSNFIAYTNEQEIQTATAGQTVFNLTTMNYLPGTGSLSVFVDGVNQYGPGAQYAFEETDQTTVTFASGLHVGASVKFTSTQIQNAGVGDASQISYTYPAVDAVTQNVEERLAQYVSVKDFGAVGDGVADDTDAIQNALNNGAAVNFTDGDFLIADKLEINNPTTYSGNGATTIIKTDSSFGATPIIEISHVAGVDPKDWTIENFVIENNGSATQAILLDVSVSGSYISKFTLSKVISTNQVANVFFELVNTTPQDDGFFTSYISDNWSLGGYYLDNVGDSVILERNTTTGAGRGYFVNQLPTASNLVIRDGNCTSAGGALLVYNGYNVTFDNMQVECPVTFTGTNNALISATTFGVNLIANLRITNSNINTQTANPTIDCINIDDTQDAVIEGNTLYCNPSTGKHIVIGSNARDTYIGENGFHSNITGADIDPIIVDNGIGTKGIWKNATLATTWTLVDPTNGFPVGFFKDIDGIVFLRGNLTGTPTGSAILLFTLPVGFRPKSKVYTIYKPYSASANFGIIIEPTGGVTLITTSSTAVYLDGISFSTK